MHRMVVRALVVEEPPIASTLSDNDRIGMRKGFAVDRPVMPVFFGFEHEGRAFIGLGCRIARTEHAVVPRKRARRGPSRPTLLSRILDDDPHPRAPLAGVGLSKNPDPRIVH